METLVEMKNIRKEFPGSYPAAPHTDDGKHMRYPRKYGSLQQPALKRQISLQSPPNR